MKKSRKDLINFSLEKNNDNADNFPCKKPDKETYDNEKQTIGNHIFNKYKNFANELKQSTEKPKFLKNNNSAADLHNLKKNLENNKRKESTMNNSVFITSPENEHNLTKIRTNSNLNRSPPKLSNYRQITSSINSYLHQQNEKRKESIDKSKKSCSLLKTQSIDYTNIGWDINKICNKEILKLQKNNRNCNEILHSPADQNKPKLFEDRVKYNSIKKSAQFTMNTSYATIDSNKSTYNLHTTGNGSKTKDGSKHNTPHNPPKYGIKTNLQKNITPDIDSQQKLKLRQKIIQPMDFSPKNMQAKEMKINDSVAFDYKPNNHTTTHKAYLDNSKANINTSKISLDKNFTIERLKSKINKKFTSFNQSKLVNKISSEKNQVREDKKGTIININNNINNNFHIMINQPHHNPNKSNANLDHTLSKISTQPDLFHTKKISLGDNIISRSNLRFKSNLSSLKELTNITQKFKNFYPGNVSFSKITELKRSKDINHKIDDECLDIRLKSDLGDTMRVDSKYDEELEEILMKNEFIEKENSMKMNRDIVDKVKKNKLSFYDDVKEKVKNRQEKNSVSEDIFNLYLNKNSHKEEKNKKIILKNKDFYSSNESSSNHLGSINLKKQSESGSLLSDESIFEISKIRKKLDKKANNTDSLSKKLSQSLKISSESNDKKSSLSKEKSTSNKDLLDASLSYNVSDEEEFQGQGSKNSAHPIKNNSEYDFDEFKTFYDEMNKKLLTYK